MQAKLKLMEKLERGMDVGSDSDEEERKAVKQASRKGKKGKRIEEDVEDDVGTGGGAEAGSDGEEEDIVAKALGRNLAYKNKQRVLVFSSRGITSRYRHLMDDFRRLIPHHKREVKLDAKDNLSVINEISEIKACNTTVFFECRKHRDLFLWISKTPSGPSVKFHVVNVHTMDELRLTGNCLRGSRPLINFDASFDSAPHWRLLREILHGVFNTPRGHPKSQPFHDHILGFYIVDNKIWMRHYQIADATTDKGERKQMQDTGTDPTSLVEIGPRCVLDPIRIFQGSFGGRTLFTNPDYTSPNQLRHQAREAMRERTIAKHDAKDARAARVAGRVEKPDVYKGVFAGEESEEEGAEEAKLEEAAKAAFDGSDAEEEEGSSDE
jgi:ribosome biogenesis protein BRX1